VCSNYANSSRARRSCNLHVSARLMSIKLQCAAAGEASHQKPHTKEPVSYSRGTTLSAALGQRLKRLAPRPKRCTSSTRTSLAWHGMSTGWCQLYGRLHPHQSHSTRRTFAVVVATSKARLSLGLMSPYRSQLPNERFSWQLVAAIGSREGKSLVVDRLDLPRRLLV
jgi:hypothetical protein